MFAEKKVTIVNESGLHARPAAIFVQMAKKFDADVKLKKGKQEVNGKSIMDVMMLAADKGSEIIIRASGEDAKNAVDELVDLLLKDMEDLSVKKHLPRREHNVSGKRR
ncbi:MAG: HPr family phosphocarrier protein [Candidatus Omnitrophica bacterium]|nr:HPr family phosphocarrier protein [Candidatus Omnitrophota bacterium]